MPITKKDALYQQLLTGIRDGTYPSEYKFPPEDVLAAQLGLSRNTVRAVLQRLESEGLILRLKSHGTFVAPRDVSRPRILLLHHIVSDVRHTFHYILPGITQELQRRNRDLAICDISQFTLFNDQQAQDIIRREHIGAIIVIDSNFESTDPLVRRLKNLHLPVILAHCYPRDYDVTGLPAVLVDIRNAWEMALTHLAAQGHRQVLTLYLKNPEVVDTIRQWTIPEYRSLLSSLKMNPSKDLLLPIDVHDQTLQSLEHHLRHHDLPTAIMAYSDFQIVPIYAILRKLKLRVPEDISVMGFCGGMDPNFFAPSLSTVDLEYANCGKLAAELADTADQWFPAVQAGTQPPPKVICPFHLVLNQSTALQPSRSVI